MRKIWLVAVLLTICTLWSLEPFNGRYFHERSIVMCFDSKTVGTSLNPVTFEIRDGKVVTGIEEFDMIADEYAIENLEQLHPFVKYSDWNENGVYLQNIYRAVLTNNEVISYALDALKKASVVVFAEYETINRVREYIPNDPLYSNCWHLPITQCPEAWDWIQGNDNVIVGIVDSGVKWNHEDLQDNIWINQPEYNAGMQINWAAGTVSGGNGVDEDGNGKVDDVIGWDYTGPNNQSEDNNPMQTYYNGEEENNCHGTHVAGCAGAVGDNGIGLVGPGMHISLMVTKGAPDNWDSGIYDGYPAIQYCTDSGAHVINCSWGGPGSGAYPNSIINYATSNGALVVSAAGNSNLEHGNDYHDYPADCDNALNVAATQQGDIKADFSDYGLPIDISAPGVSIWATYYGSTANDTYLANQGTSMASPIAAGICALVKSTNPELSPLEIRERVMNTADNIDNLNPDYAGLLGAGRINAFTATMSDKIPNLNILDYVISEVEGDNDGIPNPGDVIELQVYLGNELFWLLASDITATLSTDFEGVEITDNQATYYDLAGGSSLLNFDNPFVFSTDEALSNLSIPFTLTVNCNANNPYPYIVNLDFEVELSLMQEGWPVVINGASNSSGLIIDINNDGDNEAIFGDHLGRVHAVNNNGTELPGFPVTLAGDIKAAVAVDNISGGAELEIVAGSSNGHLYVVNSNGGIVYDNTCSGQITSNPVIADIDDNGSKEIIQYNMSGQLYVFNADGSTYAGYPYALGASVVSSPAVGDLNGDGNLELVLTTAGANAQLIGLTLSSQTSVPGFPITLGQTSWNGPVISNIDQDTNPEIVVVTYHASAAVSVKAFNHDGSQIFSNPVSTPVKTSVVTGDLDGNSSVEIVFVDNIGNVHVLDSSGNYYEGFPYAIEAAVESTPALVDMDNDGTVDIIFGDNSGYLHSVSINGYETDNFPLEIGTSAKVSAAVGYIDDDADLEILIPSESAYLLLDYKRACGDVLWPCFRGNAARTGNSFDITSAEDEYDQPSVYSDKLGRNYPNPFNPVTKINFTTAKKTDVNISVYNIKGQLVKTLVSAPYTAGNHTVSWYGDDNEGMNVSSGVYFYKMETTEYKEIKKMLLLK